MGKAEQKYETTRKALLAVVSGLKQFRQYLLGRHFIIRTDHAALSWLRRTAEPMPQLARWLTFIEQFDYEVIHRQGRRHGNADGLSRRPPVNKDKSAEMSPLHWSKENGIPDVSVPSASAIRTRPSSEVEVEERRVNEERVEDGIVRVVRENEGGIDLLVEESLLKRQQDDPDVGVIVRHRLTKDEAPTLEELETESETTKKLATKWESLEVHGGLVYRRDRGPKDGEPGFLQMLLPRSDIEDALR